MEDDGPGLPDGGAPKGSGLGTIIVRSMAETLRAELQLDTAHRGTRYVVTLAG